MATEQDDVDYRVEIVRIMERNKTIRTVVICLTIVVGLGYLVKGLVEIVEALKQPPWVTVVIAVITALIGPSGLLWFVIWLRWRYVKKTHKRVVDLEQRVDPGRTSSDD